MIDTTPLAEQDAALAEALVGLSRLVQQVFVDISRRHDLPAQQTRLLCLLQRGPLGMSEVGQRLHLEKSSLTGLVDRVERRGLVCRIRSHDDRRSCRVGLTDEGARLGATSHAEITARLLSHAARLPAGERRALAVSITRILPDQPFDLPPLPAEPG
jgi:DNA-binding MarR family transcriptional regulator